MIFSNSFFLNSLREKFCARSASIKVLPFAAEILADDVVHALLHEIIWQRKFLFLERLHDELAIDQILQRLLLGFLQLRLVFRAGVLLPEEPFPRSDEGANLGIGDDFSIHDRRDSINDPRHHSRRP